MVDNRFVTRLVFVMALLGASVLPGSAQLEIEVSHKARSIHPGEVVVLLVNAAENPVHVVATAFGKPVYFFRTADNVWTGLVGIDLTVGVGTHDVDVTATADDGVMVQKTYPLVVQSKEFPTRRLSVNPSFVSPPEEVIERIQRESRTLDGIFSTATEERMWRDGFLRPVDGESTSSFGRRSVFNGQPRSPHSGTDFRATEGTPIKSPNGGKVVLATDLYFSGNVVVIDHGLGLYSYFAHLSSIDVTLGEDVSQGKVVGKVGSTGRVTGPHLHWTVRLNGSRVDPLSLMELFPFD